MRILLVEDSERLQRSLKIGLEQQGFTVDQAYDGVEALEWLSCEAYAAVVLDLMLPRISGLDVLQRMRTNGNESPVLILSAMDQLDHRIKGLDAGADDYLVKPFALEELVSRLRALIRRDSWTRDSVMQLDELMIDSDRRQVSFRDTIVELSPVQFHLLNFLARNRGRVYSKEQLITQLYSGDAEITINTIEAHIYNLRKRLLQSGVSDPVRTHRGFGYMIP
jgi:DNA-binding response OmpR family regulator